MSPLLHIIIMRVPQNLNIAYYNTLREVGNYLYKDTVHVNSTVHSELSSKPGTPPNGSL